MYLAQLDELLCIPRAKTVKRSTKFRTLVMSLVVLGISTVASLLLAEGFLRLFPGFLPIERRQYMLVDLNNVGVAHPYIGHLHSPQTTRTLAGPDFKAEHRTDAAGFRNRDPWPTPADIVVLGDSLAFGYGVDDQSAWPALLAASFPDLGVVNLGLIGAGPEQYLRVYQTFGTELNPRLVIAAVFPGNDFWDAGKFEEWQNSGAEGNYMVWRNQHGAPDWSRDPVAAFRLLLLRRSYLYNLAVATAKAYRDREASAPVVVTLRDGSEMRMVPGEFQERTAGSERGRREFELVEHALRRLRDQSRSNGSQLLVVIQPSKEEVYMPLTGESVRDAAAFLRVLFDELGIEYLDLLPRFRQQAEEKALFFESDGHPNAAGYHLIFESLAAHLKARRAAYGLTGERPTGGAGERRSSMSGGLVTDKFTP
jgi:lysophospholipase L1-like esterase